MSIEQAALSALLTFVVVVLVLAALEVMQRRFGFDPVTFIARPFFPGVPPSSPTGSSSSSAA